MLEKYQKMHIGTALLLLIKELKESTKVYSMQASEENLKAVVNLQRAISNELKNRANPATAVKFIYITCPRELLTAELLNVLVKFQMDVEDYHSGIKRVLRRVDKKSLEFKINGGFWEAVNYKYELQMLRAFLLMVLEIESSMQLAMFALEEEFCKCGGSMVRVSPKWNSKGVILACNKCGHKRVTDGYDILLEEVNKELSNFKEDLE